MGGLNISNRYLLEAHQLTRVFQQGKKEIAALRGVNIRIPQHSLVALKGKSGSGKTTLMNLLGGLDVPTEGSVSFRDQKYDVLNETKKDQLRKSQIGFIFQTFALMSMMSAGENVELTLRVAKHPAREWRERIQEALEMVGLSKREKHRPNELSGGEQQRVAIARAIVNRPSLVLADEPTSELDTKMTFQMIRLFRSLVDNEGMTIVLTTHDPAVLHMTDYIYELEDGRLVESDTAT